MPEEMVNRMMSSLGMDDVNIPELKLVQATGGDYAKESGAQPGQFFVSTTNEILDGIDVQGIGIIVNRTFWGRTDITDDPPICSSLDGKKSVDGQVCRDCQHYRERASLDKEQRRKECQQGFVFYSLDEKLMPLIIRLNGISADAGRDIGATFKFNRAFIKNPGAFFFHLNSFKKKSAAGDAWAVKVSLSKDKYPSAEAIAEYQRISTDMGIIVPVQIASLKAAEIAAPAPGTAESAQKVIEAADKLLEKSEGKETQTPPQPPSETGESVIEDLKF